ncbi:MAG: hypothetical protein J0H66_11350 [Solirubrobacterales bacterium]|nr:hypothetical protein [Solirubrobacterales bacterium]OJU94827.1 MAG: hypothetical protein BGO23_08245 [Solirubrobacterales bacterium 67-14]
MSYDNHEKIMINGDLLDELGLGGLPLDVKNLWLKLIHDTLETRVGMAIAGQLSDEQLDEFEAYFEANDGDRAFAFLETNFPNYGDVVKEEFRAITHEVVEDPVEFANEAILLLEGVSA